jgi:hypothetical protein
MAFPTVESITPTDFDLDGTTHNVTLPTPISAGDLLLALCAFDLTVTYTTPTGWHDFGEFHADDNPATRIFGLIAVGTEDGAVVNFATDASERGGITVYRISGTHDVIADVVEFSGLDIASPIDPPSLTPSWGADDTLWIVAAANSSSSASSPTAAPASYGSFTAAGSLPLTGGSDAAVWSAHRQANTATENPAAFTGGTGYAVTIAVQPAQAATGTVASTLQRALFTGTGVQHPQGSLASTLSKALFSGTGAQTSGPSGSIASILQAATFAAQGVQPFTGTLAATMQAATFSGSGVYTVAPPNPPNSRFAPLYTADALYRPLETIGARLAPINESEASL